MADPTMADVFRAIIKIREETPDLAWMLDIPGVNKLLIRRASGEIDDQKFRYELYRTKWWKQTSDSQRQWRTLVSIDPAKARRQRQEMAETVQRMVSELGLRLPGKGAIQSGDQGKAPYQTTGATAVARIADLALYNGWSQDQLTNYLLSFATFGQEGRNPTGGIAVALRQVRQLEEQYGVTSRNKNRFRAVRQILSGRETIEGYEEKLRARAIATYGASEDVRGVLERGGTVEEWFDPYRQMIAQELEVPEAEVSMNTRKWRNVLLHDDGTRTRSMTMDEALKYVRSQEEWADTRGGKEKEAEMVSTLLGVFGKRA